MSRSSANANTVPCPLTKIRQVRHASSSARIKAAECAGKREGRSVRPSSVVQPHAPVNEITDWYGAFTFPHSTKSPFAKPGPKSVPAA